MQAVLDSITIQELGTLMSETTFSQIVDDGFAVVELSLAQQEQAFYYQYYLSVLSAMKVDLNNIATYKNALQTKGFVLELSHPTM